MWALRRFTTFSRSTSTNSRRGWGRTEAPRCAGTEVEGEARGSITEANTSSPEPPCLRCRSFLLTFHRRGSRRGGGRSVRLSAPNCGGAAFTRCREFGDIATDRLQNVRQRTTYRGNLCESPKDVLILRNESRIFMRMKKYIDEELISEGNFTSSGSKI